MRVKDYPDGTLSDTSRMLFDNEETGTHSVDVATLKEQFGGGGQGFSGSIYDYVDEMTKDGKNLWLRKSVFRGKNLGSTLTDEQKAAITDGSFKGLFLGDYWTYYNAANKKMWIPIVDFDYWYEEENQNRTEANILYTGSTTKHHIAVLRNMGPMEFFNDSHPVSGGYGNSNIMAELMKDPSVSSLGVGNVFPSDWYIKLAQRVPLSISSGGVVLISEGYDESSENARVAYGRIPNQRMIFGHDVVRRTNESYIRYTDPDFKQLSAYEIGRPYYGGITSYQSFGGFWISDFFFSDSYVDPYTPIGIYINLNYRNTSIFREVDYLNTQENTIAVCAIGNPSDAVTGS